MEPRLIFVSVGSTCNQQQEDFVKAVEERLRSEGLVPQTVGRNTFSSDAPLKAVTELMDKCAGIMVIALERTYYPAGIEKRGSRSEKALVNVRLPTPWNHIEAAMAYSRNLPIFAVVQEGLRSEGLLEPGYDWYVLSIPLDQSRLNSAQFNGILNSWKEKLNKPNQIRPAGINAAEMTVAELLGSLRPLQLWSLIGTIVAVIGGAFTLGLKLHELNPKPSNAIHQGRPLEILAHRR